MVARQIAGRGVRDAAVLASMRKVPRERFVPAPLASLAYEDQPLAIGEGQTISQPYVVAAMEELELHSRDRVLEVGTGSGYAAAVLATIVAEVYTIERLEGLATSADRRLAGLGYANVHVRHGDGSLGWPEHAPYDAIVVTASAPDVPTALLQQLKMGRRLVIPVGPKVGTQRLVWIVQTSDEDYARQTLEKVVFVRLIGAEGWSEGEEAEKRARDDRRRGLDGAAHLEATRPDYLGERFRAFCDITARAFLMPLPGRAWRRSAYLGGAMRTSMRRG